MKLPTWALRALSFVNSTSERGEWQSGLLSRFESNWYRLDADKWKIPEWHQSYRQGHTDKELSAADLVRKRILETALDIEWDRQTTDLKARPDQALKEFERLNSEIVSLAGNLAACFRRRGELMHLYALEDTGDSELGDPFDFWSAFEDAMQSPEFRDWAYVAQNEIGAFLRIARSQSRARPRWPDLLEEITKRQECKAFVGAVLYVGAHWGRGGKNTAAARATTKAKSLNRFVDVRRLHTVARSAAQSRSVSTQWLCSSPLAGSVRYAASQRLRGCVERRISAHLNWIM